MSKLEEEREVLHVGGVCSLLPCVVWGSLRSNSKGRHNILVLDSLLVLSHLKREDHYLPSPQVSDSYCSLAAHKSEALGCLLKGGFGSKVIEPCPLAPTHQMAPQGFSGCQRAFSLSLFLSSTFPPNTPLHSLTQPYCHSVLPPFPLLLLNNAPIFFLSP